MNPAKKMLRLAILATVFAFVSPVAFAGTVTVQHGTLSATLGAPVNFSYTPNWYVVNDPTGTIGLGLQPYATLGSTMASVQCQGSANLSVSQNPGWNTLSLTASSGTATMNLGLTAGLNIEFIAFGNTLQGTLNNTPNWGFTDSQNFSTYLLNNPVTLSGQISQNLVSLNTLDALTLEFGFVIPSWLAGINLNINAVANLNQTIQGTSISTSAGTISSEGQSLNVYTSGTSYQLQNVQETWSDSASLSLGLGADMSADLLDGILSVELVNFGDVTLISASQVYQLQSSAIPTVSFDLSTSSGSTAPMISTVSPSTMTGLPIGQTQLVRIIGSGFTTASTLTFNDGVDSPFTGRVPTFVSVNELDYNISVGTNQASWSVVVVNGSQTSNLGYFTVNAPSGASSGSLVVNLSPAGAVSAGAQWQVDGGSYYSSGGVDPVLAPGSHTVSFKSVSGYTTPSSQIVTITANAQTTASGSYTVIAPSTYTLTLNSDGVTGYIVNQPFGTGSGNIYNPSAVVQLTANAYSGYHFVSWAGDASGSGTQNPTTITMNGNKTVSANFAAGDTNLGTVIVTIQPPEAVTAGVTWGFNDNDFRASGTSYSYYPETLWVELHNTNGWIGYGGWVTFTAGVTTNYIFAASYTNGSIIGSDPRTYYTLAGSASNSGSSDGTNSSARFTQPKNLAADNAGNVFVVDGSVIRKVTAEGIVTTIAGTAGVSGSADGQGTNASFNNPIGIAIDQSNNLYVADFMNSTIRKITPGGMVSTFAGLAGNNGSVDANGTSARFYFPVGVAVSPNGNIYVSDSVNETIRQITPNGDVTTLAGLARSYGYADGTGSAARFHNPCGLAADASNNVYVADEVNEVIRKVTPSGVVTTLAGYPGSSGAADGTGNAARFYSLNSVAVDSSGNIYVADTSNQAIRKTTPNGVVTTLAGQSGNPGSADGVGSVVRFYQPSGVAVNLSGTLFVADMMNYTIRATQPLASKVNQTIVFPPIPNHSAGDLPFAISATASSGLPVYFGVLSGPALINSNIVTLVGGGTVTVVAWQPGDADYNEAATVQQSFTVTQVPQTITFSALSPQKYGDAPFSISATASSGLPVSFSLLSGPAQLSGNIVTLTNAGTVTIQASQPGNSIYAAASNVIQSLVVASPDTNPPTITIISPLPNARLSNAVVTVSGTATDNVQVASVLCSLNNGAWSYATGTTNWTNSLAFAPGTNVLQAYSMDTSGNRSVTNSVSFIGVFNTVLSVRTNGLGSINPVYNGQLLTVGQAYSMTATAGSGFVFTNWTISTNWIGGSVTNNATVQFMMASNLTLQANFTDTNRPALSITNLTAGQRWSNVVFTVKGTASDNWQVSNVVCQINGGGWNSATNINNWMNWAAGVILVPGTNVVQACAMDTSGNVSTTSSVGFQFVVTNQLQIHTVGLGTISPNYSNSWLEIGRNYSITSTPASGFVANNWVISTNWLGGVRTNGKAVHFMMQSNLTLQVTFADVTRPTNTVTAPAAGQHMTNALATVVGTAKDNWKVAAVWYQLNSAPWNLVNTTNFYTNWTKTVTLLAGTNTLKAYAMDLGGNFSATNTLSVVSSNTFMLQLAFTNALPLKTNGLVFNLQLSKGLNGHIQVSTNLTSWTALTNFVGTNATITFRDPAATNSPRRFYRAVVP